MNAVLRFFCPQGKEKGRAPKGATFFDLLLLQVLALTGLVALLRLVDHIDAAFTAHNLAIAVTRLQRAERVRNFHRPSPVRGASAPIENNVPLCRGGEWWAVLGSNQWPLRCQRSALPLS